MTIILVPGSYFIDVYNFALLPRAMIGFKDFCHLILLSFVAILPHFVYGQSPQTLPDVASTNQSIPVTFNVVENDSDPVGINPATVDLITSTTEVDKSVTTTSGSFTVNEKGDVTFAPLQNFFGTTTLNYTVKNNEGITSSPTLITVNVNGSPVAQDDVAATNVNTEIIIDVSLNDSDPDGSVDKSSVDVNPETEGIQTERSNSTGTYTANSTGSVKYVPSPTFVGTASISYTIRDNQGAVSNSATITITVNAVNSAPVANSDLASTNEDVPVSFNILQNDTDDGMIDAATTDLDPSSEGIQNTITIPAGTFTVNTTGVVTFVPVLNFNGNASASYTVKDTQGAISNTANIAVTVNAVNDPPAAQNDVASTNENLAVTINVIANDADVDGAIDPATVDLNLTLPGIQNSFTTGGGGFTVNASGVVTFTPSSGTTGNVSISYTVNDNEGATSNAASITVTVNAVNISPVANNDVATTNHNTPVNINILANDTDDKGINPSTVDINKNVEGIQTTYAVNEGSFVYNGAGVVTYTPATGFSGSVSIHYTVNDTNGATSNLATITVNVLPPIDEPANKPPVAHNDFATTNEGSPVTISILDNDTDEDGLLDRATVDLDLGTAGIQNTITLPSGVFSVTAQGLVTFTPAENFFGNPFTTYRVNDNAGATSNPGTISVTVVNVNDPPYFDAIANQERHRNAIQKTITITGVSAGPFENEQMTFTAVSQNTTLVSHPSISYNGISSSATLTFQPQPNQVGTADVTVKVVDAGQLEFSRTFQVHVVDGRITSIPVTVAVVNEPYEYLIQTTELPDAVIDGTPSIVATQKPAWLNITHISKFSAKLSGTPPANATTSVVQIQFRDGASLVDQQAFTLMINHRPTVSAIAIKTEEDVTFRFSAEKFLAAYSDPDNHPISEIQFTGLPKHGQLKLNDATIAIGQSIPFASIAAVLYVPAKDYAGADTLLYKASDGFSLSAQSAILHFVIQPVNDPPEIISLEAEPLSFDIGKEVAQNFSATFQAKDVDGDLLTGAEIGFRRPNFQSDHDVLEFINTTKIKGIYDNQLGILSLTGEATDIEYSEAIRSIKYNFKNLKDIVRDARSVYITLSDGKSISETREREIQLIYTFTPLDIPNVFTPDGNGPNDFWNIREKGREGRELEQYDDAVIRVFTHRGKLVFETVGFDKKWDGTSNGQPLPVGTYFYTIDLNYGKVRYKGTVTLLRTEK